MVYEYCANLLASPPSLFSRSHLVSARTQQSFRYWTGWSCGTFLFPILNNLFASEDENLSANAAAQVAVLSYGFWQSHYGGARDAIGKTLKIEGIPFTIIGVTRKGFTGISADMEMEVTLPLPARQLFGGEAD